MLIATSIAEEGLDIGSVDLVINYDHTKSTTRRIQRMGRTGRKRRGKQIYIVTDYERNKVAEIDAQDPEGQFLSFLCVANKEERKKVWKAKLNYDIPPWTDLNPILPNAVTYRNLQIKEDEATSSSSSLIKPKRSRQLLMDKYTGNSTNVNDTSREDDFFRPYSFIENVDASDTTLAIDDTFNGSPNDIFKVPDTSMHVLDTLEPDSMPEHARTVTSKSTVLGVSADIHEQDVINFFETWQRAKSGNVFPELDINEYEAVKVTDEFITAQKKLDNDRVEQIDFSPETEFYHILKERHLASRSNEVLMAESAATKDVTMVESDESPGNVGELDDEFDDDESFLEGVQMAMEIENKAKVQPEATTRIQQDKIRLSSDEDDEIVHRKPRIKRKRRNQTFSNIKNESIVSENTKPTNDAPIIVIDSDDEKETKMPAPSKPTSPLQDTLEQIWNEDTICQPAVEPTTEEKMQFDLEWDDDSDFQDLAVETEKPAEDACDSEEGSKSPVFISTFSQRKTNNVDFDEPLPGELDASLPIH